MTPAVFAMVQERSTSVDARTFQKATAIAMATNSTPLAFVEAHVWLTSMGTTSAMWMKLTAVKTMACNYNPDATDDDGSCEYTSCAGCTDSVALNYDETATIDDGSCDGCNLLLSTEVLQPIVCEGDENGVVELILGNVVYPDSITIELNGVVQDTTVLGLGAGSYTVSVSQGTDCAATLDFDLEDGTALSVAIETSNVTCAGEDNGSIDATALSGVLPIEYVLFWPSVRDQQHRQLRRLARRQLHLERHGRQRLHV